MSKRTLVIIGVIALLVLVAGPLLMGLFGAQVGLGYGMMGFGWHDRGMMGGMYPGMMGGYGPNIGLAGWGWMALFGLLRVFGWVAQVAIIAVIVAWLLKPRVAQNPNPPQN